MAQLDVLAVLSPVSLGNVPRMLDVLTAIRFEKVFSSGRNLPMLLECERANGESIHVVAKFSASETGIGGLIREAWAAMLAADLGLPVPEPFIVSVSDDFTSSIPESESKSRTQIERSLDLAFGSSLIGPGFSTWPQERRVPIEQRNLAAEIFCFDALILNGDRKPDKPNCITDGDEIFIFDHELSLLTEAVGVFPPYPWQIGGQAFLGPTELGAHVFAKSLKGKQFDLDRLFDEWSGISGDRINEYEAAIPVPWAATSDESEAVSQYLILLSANLESAVEETRRVLA